MKSASVAILLAFAVLAAVRGAISDDEDDDPLVQSILDSARAGDLQGLQRLLEEDPRLANAAGKKDGKTPLHWAAYFGNKEAVLLLLKHNAKIDQTDRFGSTPLQGAAYSGHTETVRLLVGRGADIHAVDRYGNSILDAASYDLDARSCERRCATASFLLERGAPVDGGRTGYFPIDRFVAVGDANCTRTFLARGASMKNRDKGGLTALHWAAKGLYVSKEELLTEKLYLGGEVAPRSSSGPSRYQEVVGLLVAAGSDLNARNNFLETPLHVAAAAGNRVVSEALIQAGADIDAPDKDKNTPLFFAARLGRTDIVKLLLSNKADVNARNHVGYTPLILAIRWGEPKDAIGVVARMLLDGGADVNARKPGGGWGLAGTDGETALQQAAEFGYASVVDLLIHRGADVNPAFKDGRTPLYWAAKNGYEEIVEILIRNGANVNVKVSGRSALKAARQEGRNDIYELLVRHGATE